MTEHELLPRPLLAVIAGGLLGLERSFHGRPARPRTYGLGSFASGRRAGRPGDLAWAAAGGRGPELITSRPPWKSWQTRRASCWCTASASRP